MVGVDQSRQMLDLAAAKTQDRGVALELQQGGADSLPLPDGSRDAVTEWYRVLRPGGRLVLVEGDWRGRTRDPHFAEDAPDFVRDYETVRHELPLFGGRPADHIAELVHAAGFTEVGIEHLDEVVRITSAGSRRHARSRALELMDLVGIPDRTSRYRHYPHEFSGPRSSNCWPT